MKIIIAGSRNFADYDLLKRTLARWTRKLKAVEVVSGHAEGADRLGERWALEEAPKLFGYGRVSLKIFRPDYEKHGGKLAPIIRNSEMVEYCRPDGAAIFLWDGASKGTLDCLSKAKRAGLRVKVVKYLEEW